MSRPSLLTVTQCEKARALHARNPKRWNAGVLAKRFGVSESSMYNVFNGSYIARADEKKSEMRTHVVKAPHIPPTKSIFNRDNGMDLEVDLVRLGEPSELEVAAAQLVLAKSKFLRAARELQHA